MAKETDRKSKSNSNIPLKIDKDPAFEERKREAYSAMGRLGGLARAKQMAEKGFVMANELKNNSKPENKNKGKDSAADDSKKK